MRDILEIPESLFMFSNSFVSYDHTVSASFVILKNRKMRGLSLHYVCSLKMMKNWKQTMQLR